MPGSAERLDVLPRSRAAVLVMALLVVLGGWTLFRFAWIADDSLISARAVANATHGEGLVANTDERVQSFTHPLWVIVWSLLALATGEIVLTPVILGLTLAVATLAVLGMTATASWFGAVALTGLVLSTTFGTWGTSGLENAMAGALVATAWALSRDPPDAARPLVVAGLLGLLCLTRLDLAILAAPVTLWLVHQQPTWTRRGAVLGAVAGPSLAYLAWCWAYYGFALPATFYAKTNVDIPQGDLLAQGVRYLWVSLNSDPIGAVLLLVGLVWLARSSVPRRPDLRRLAWLAGSLLYLAYVVWVGGDFMAGRFLYVPIVVAAGSIAEPPAALTASPRRAVPWLLTSLVLIVLAAPTSSPLSDEGRGERWDFATRFGVADERGFYVGLGHSVSGYLTGRETGAAIGAFRAQAADWDPQPLGPGETRATRVVCGRAGAVGLLVGANVHLIDPCGLSDMVMAQTAYAPAGSWRIGHFERPIPEGYVESVERGRNVVADPEAHALVDEVWGRIRTAQP